MSPQPTDPSGDFYREFLRGEIALTLRWLCKPQRLMLLTLYLLSVLLVGSLRSLMAGGRGAMIGFGLFAGPGLSGLLIAILWLWALESRTFRFFSKERLEDLLLCPVDLRKMWPAFLAAPVTVLLISAAAGLLKALLDLCLYALGGVSGPADALLPIPVLMSLPLLWAGLVAPFENLLFGVAITFIVVYRALPRPFGKTLLLAMFYWCALKFFSFICSSLASFISSYLMWGGWGTFFPTNSGQQDIARWAALSGLVREAVVALLCIIIIAEAWRGLRGRKMMEKLRRAVDLG